MPNLPVCVDASFVIRLLESKTEESSPATLWQVWHTDLRPIVAPTLLYYEITNALHRYVVHGYLRPEHARAALEATFDLDITLYGDAHLHAHAFQIAERLNLPAAYDAHYLALSERLGAEFWTADRQLVRAVGDKLLWVRLVE
ncbi:MAG: PIN domain-containing protein [Caldilineae bacterium]|nr:MAG: PIN domain-containing protein [Caldilineae bacterium]